MQNKDIAEQLGVGRVQVSRWRERYAQSRLAGIERDRVALRMETAAQRLPKMRPDLPKMAAQLGQLVTI